MVRGRKEDLKRLVCANCGWSGKTPSINACPNCTRDALLIENPSIQQQWQRNVAASLELLAMELVNGNINYTDYEDALAIRNIATQLQNLSEHIKTHKI
jgi:hypothetical protein